MLTKQHVTRVKAHKDADGKPTGEVTAVVSVFGNVDVVGDRVVKGAFAKSLAEWKDSGDPIPMVWSHDWSNPMSHIGAWDPAKAIETDEGLELTGTVDIGKGNPVADQAYRLMAEKRVREFSFAYDVHDEKSAADGANELLDLGLIEAGPTLKGANSETRLLAAKALERSAKVGRALSAKNESTLREAADALDAASKSIKSVLASLGEPKSADVEEAKDVAEAIAADAEAEAQVEAQDVAPEETKQTRLAATDDLLSRLEDAEIVLTLGLADAVDDDQTDGA